MFVPPVSQAATIVIAHMLTMMLMFRIKYERKSFVLLNLEARSHLLGSCRLNVLFGFTLVCPQRSEADDKADKKERSSKVKTSRANDEDKESKKEKKSTRKRVNNPS